MKRFEEETDLIQIIKTMRMMKLLPRIIMSKDQINLLKLGDSSILYKNYGTKVQRPFQIVLDENGIEVRSSMNEEDYKSEAQIISENIPSYLSKHVNEEYEQFINKLVTGFGNQEVTLQNLRILHLAHGFPEDILGKKCSEESSSQSDLLPSKRPTLRISDTTSIPNQFPHKNVVKLMQRFEITSIDEETKDFQNNRV